MPEEKDRTTTIRGEFITARGDWSLFRYGLPQRSPDFFEACPRFSAVPWTNGGLKPKVKELIHIAIDASTRTEIMEAFQPTSVPGMHTCTMGVPALLDEMAKAGHAA